MKLSKLLKSLKKCRIYGSSNVDVVSIIDDSRKVKKGSLFVAISGLTVDGHKFIPEVIKKGATVVVGEKAPEKKWLEKITYIKVKNSRKALALLASVWHGYPSRKLKVIGVTGTKGKTTTSEFLYQILNKAGVKVGLISTVSAKIGNKVFDTGLHTTNPEPLILQKFLAKMVEEKCTHAILEVTSHGLDQERVVGINFDIAILTNITHEHFDYHKTFDNYRRAKARLFKDVEIAILNKDDESFGYISNKVPKKSKIISYSLKDKDSDMHLGKINTSFKGENLKALKILGDYNISNILATIACAGELKISWGDIESVVSKIKMPTGRLEKIKSKKGINIYIDFAHTPDSLENVLTFLKKHTKRRLICVFGCAGERDVKKRSMMGGISTKLSDVSVFTAEDPRSEDVNKIIQQMVSGVKKTGTSELKIHYYHATVHGSSDKRKNDNNGGSLLNKKLVGKNYFLKIPERGEAIAFAINKLAMKGDTVVVCGKGHEKSMAYEGTEYPWSDHEAIRIALEGGVKKIKRKKRQS